MHVKPTPSWKPESAPTFWVNHASRLIVRHFEQRLRPLGFGMAYLPVLVPLQEEGELTQKELAERTRVEQPTMAALLGRMDRDGLLLRKPHPTDKRSSRISLSAKAKARLPAAMEQMAAVAERATAGLSQRERATLILLLRRVVDNLDPAREA
jgi:MarR family transcriptional regulator for hemolysin